MIADYTSTIEERVAWINLCRHWLECKDCYTKIPDDRLRIMIKEFDDGNQDL